MTEIYKENTKRDDLALTEDLERRFGPAMAQQIMDELKKAENPKKVASGSFDYMAAKTLSEASEIYRREAQAALRLYKIWKGECGIAMKDVVDTLEKYGVKLKPTHAHELGAAFFGYASKNAMLADTKWPVSNLHQAQIIVMAPDAFIDQRRKDLQDLSPELPDSYALGEGVYAALFSEQWWSSPYPPFRSFEKMATYIADEDVKKRGPGGAYRNHASEDIKIEHLDDAVKVTFFAFIAFHGWAEYRKPPLPPQSHFIAWLDILAIAERTFLSSLNRLALKQREVRHDRNQRT